MLHRKLRLSEPVKTLLLILLLTCSVAGEDLLTGFRQQPIEYQGPGEWRTSVEPVWVYAYDTLRLTYRASGLPQSDAPILTLRPGSVGPVTPGATNPENPFVAGMPVVVVAAQDLIPDGARHTLEVRLKGKMHTPQIDQLRYTLPSGARFAVDGLEFRGSKSVLPCEGGPALPVSAATLKIAGPAECSGFPATSMRGRESIRIAGNGQKGRTLYLSLYPHFASVGMFAANQLPEKMRVKESSETAEACVRLKYTDGEEAEQFPLLVDERRHALLNRAARIYALELDPQKTLASAEIMDRSAHVQLLLFAAGISTEASPQPQDELPVFTLAPKDRTAARPDLSASAWFRISAVPGKNAPGAALRTKLTDREEMDGRRLSLEIKNVSAGPQEFTVAFPSVTVRPSAVADDVWYVFPRQGAVISRAERTLEAAYNAAFPLQFVDVFAPVANTGASVIVRDTEGRGKKFRIRKIGVSVEVEVEYLVRLAPGGVYRPPDAQLTEHGGDWHQGFATYQKWLASWYKPKGPRPKWLQRAFWARRDYPIGGTNLLYDTRRNRYTFDEFIRDGEAFGGIDFIDISGWALSDSAGRVGDYPIELGGSEDLRKNVAAGLEANIPTGLYFEGYLIDKNSKVGRRNGPEWQLIDEKGQGEWWNGGSPELFVCPYVRGWRQYLSQRVAVIARESGAGGVYLDEFGFGRMRCYSRSHGHPPGVETLPGETGMAKEVRRALDAAGAKDTMLYIEETPPDAAAPYYDAAFCYNLPYADQRLSPLKLNLSRFAFPDIRLWDMLSIGIDPRILPAEDFRLSLWHGNGLWLKGHSDTWYGEDLLKFIRSSHALLQKNADAFNGTAEPLVESPHPSVFINRFTGGGKTVHTLFNASYRTVRFSFQGEGRTLAPRDVAVIGALR
ncbi:MAG TPA: DUF6259 domain-containing protein [Bryobacteraceae bacterium]|nr:DUF6259 domain-containing protein [Bryobacteraceae bacterium]